LKEFKDYNNCFLVSFYVIMVSIVMLLYLFQDALEDGQTKKETELNWITTPWLILRIEQAQLLL